MDRFELASKCLDQGVEELAKGHSMQELQSMFCQLVKAPQAPKFSDKTAAAKRVLHMAEEVEKSAPALVSSPVPELDEIFSTPKKGRGRPKSGPRTYYFQEPTSKHADLLPKQAKAILDNVVHGAELSESDLQAQIDELAAGGKLSTKQDPWRIFLYYRAKLISYGALKMHYV